MRMGSNVVGVMVLALTLAAGGRAGAARPQARVANDSAEQRLVGTWEGDGPSDEKSKQHVVLELRGDHTYTKTLDAVVDGRFYGGTHSGTWKANGNRVYLSGDGNFPPYVQDLSLMRKTK